mmetsp:Transcript_8528/g.24355  ORF Transcript_8528/g.24355 Transcript_8528/m.24355 type:complete len:207 (-) Transcript_8528:534-1154(-)
MRVDSCGGVHDLLAAVTILLKDWLGRAVRCRCSFLRCLIWTTRAVHHHYCPLLRVAGVTTAVVLLVGSFLDAWLLVVWGCGRRVLLCACGGLVVVSLSVAVLVVVDLLGAVGVHLQDCTVRRRGEASGGGSLLCGGGGVLALYGLQIIVCNLTCRLRSLALISNDRIVSHRGRRLGHDVGLVSGGHDVVHHLTGGLGGTSIGLLEV